MSFTLKRAVPLSTVASWITGSLQWVVLTISSLAIVVSLVALGVFVFFPDIAEEYTAGLRPSLSYAELPSDQIDENLEQKYLDTFGVAHNSGGSVSATLVALYSGADAIEIDVVSVDGSLYSSHASPLPLIGVNVFRGPPLAEVWTAAAQTDLVKFDLKESSPEFLELVHDFLVTHQRDHQIVVATDDPASHRFFAARMPDILSYYSIGSDQDLAELREDPEMVGLIDGVSIQNDVVDEETTEWMNEHGLHMLVWTVNDLERANELIRLGVTAMTTDNLALLALFGGLYRDEAPLPQTQATPQPTEPEGEP